MTIIFANRLFSKFLLKAKKNKNNLFRLGFEFYICHFCNALLKIKAIPTKEIEIIPFFYFLFKIVKYKKYHLGSSFHLKISLYIPKGYFHFYEIYKS